MGAAGLLLLAGFFWIQSQTQEFELLRMKMSRAELLERAEADFSRSVFAQYPLRTRYTFELNKPLFRYAVTHRDSLPDKHHLPLIEFQYKRTGTVTLANGARHEVQYSATYSGSGHLLGISRSFPEVDTTVTISFDEAVSRAKNFLFAAAFDTTGMNLEQNSLYRKNDLQTYNFVLSRTVTGSHGALRAEHKVTIAGGEVVEFACKIEPVNSKAPHDFTIIEMILIAFAVLSALIALTLIIATSVQKNRRDELDYHHSGRIALFSGTISLISVAILVWPDQLNAFLGAPVAALFIGFITLVFFAVAESTCRDVWPEKLELTDALFRRIFRIRELGEVFHLALFTVGVVLFWYGLAHYFTDRMQWSYLAESAPFWVFKSQFERLLAVTNNLTNWIVGWVISLVFFPAWLAAKIPDRRKWFVVYSIFLLGFSLATLIVSPVTVGMLLMSGVSLAVAFLVYRSAALASLIVFVIGFLARDLSYLLLSPDALSDILLIAFWGGLFLLWVAGVYLEKYGVPLSQVEHYVPDYFGRIAERERVRKELEIARNVQMRFLPDSIPDVPGLDIASICRPATEVGGDYYDFLSVDKRWLGVVIGDVSGKGVSAAFYMTMAKGILKTLARTIRMPAQLLREMNAVFFENSPRQIFISVIYGVFDLENGFLHFARAGHNPLIVRKKKAGTPEKLHPRGIAIGLADTKKFEEIIEEQTIAIEPGDIFVFYTDGISEAMNSAEEIFGEERLSKLIEDNEHLTARELLDLIHDEIVRFEENTPQHDDSTMIVVKVLPR